MRPARPATCERHMLDSQVLSEHRSKTSRLDVTEMKRAGLQELTSSGVDLLVVGGGIVGCGIARDAALRGLRVALIEREDVGAGTTSRSTRLIHGGLRYLELFDFALV